MECKVVDEYFYTATDVVVLFMVYAKAGCNIIIDKQYID